MAMAGRRSRRTGPARSASSASQRQSAEETSTSQQEQIAADAAASSVQTASQATAQTDSTQQPAASQKTLQPAPAPRSNNSTSSRAKVGVPKFVARRSQAGRAEQDKAEAEKRKAEQDARAREEARKAKQNIRPRGAGGPGRGGYIGQSDRQRQETFGAESIASGPFSLGKAAPTSPGKRRAQTSFATSGRGGGGIRSTATHGPTGKTSASAGDAGPTSTPVVKAEPGTGALFYDIEREDGRDISSDEEQEDKGPRKNVDDLEYIDLTADDNFAPVRVHRFERRNRAMGLSVTRAATVNGAPDAEDIVSPFNDLTDKKILKQNSGDVQVTQERQTFQGHWRDSSDSEPELHSKFKEEAVEDAEGESSRLPPPFMTNAEFAAVGDLPSSPEPKRKGKERAKRSSSATTAERPVFQTNEERIEWELLQEDRELLRSELGEPAVDLEGDATMGGDRRANKLYLFQFPPFLPDLVPVNQATPSADDDGDAMQVDDEPAPEPTFKKETINIEDDRPETPKRPKMPSGRVGKLRVHKSGKAYLDWGGLSFEVSMGTRASFLQDVMMVKMDPKSPDDNGHTRKKEEEIPERPDDQTKANEEEFGGKAIALGQVKGKFIVTPDWSAMLD